MLGIISRAYGVLGLGSSALGIAGWQDDARAWAKWAEMNPELAGALMGAGGIMVITWLVWEIMAWRKRGRRAKSAPAEAQPVINQTFNFSAGTAPDDLARQLRDEMEGKTVRGLKETIRKLPQHPLSDGHTYATLPDGTNIVSMADGSYRLALPVRLSVDFEGGLDGSLNLSPEVKKGPSAAEDDEGAAAEKAWRISPAAGLLAAKAIEKATSIDEARRIFRAFQAKQSRRNVSEAYAAYTARLKREGLADSEEAFDVGWDEGGEP